MPPRDTDPTQPIQDEAASYPDAVAGTSCNQTSFKVGKTAFLYVGPGAKGIGFKAMFKLDRSLAKVAELAAKDPDRYGVGSNGWVTARFTAEKPLAKTLWKAWLKESYGLATGSAPKKTAAPKKKASPKKP